MRMSVKFVEIVDRLPKTCSECPFSDVCDGRVAILTKQGGVEWKKSATERVSRHCPMEIEEN